MINDNIYEVINKHCQYAANPTDKGTDALVTLVRYKLDLAKPALLTTFGSNMTYFEHFKKILGQAEKSCLGLKIDNYHTLDYITDLFSKVTPPFMSFGYTPGRFQMFCEANGDDIVSMKPKQMFQKYYKFVDKIYKLLLHYDQEYVLHGKFPTMFLSAETCHLEEKDFMTKLRADLRDMLKRSEALSKEITLNLVKTDTIESDVLETSPVTNTPEHDALLKMLGEVNTQISLSFEDID